MAKILKILLIVYEQESARSEDSSPFIQIPGRVDEEDDASAADQVLKNLWLWASSYQCVLGRR